MTLGWSGSFAWAGTSPKQTLKNAISATESVTSVKIIGEIHETTQTISLDVSASTAGVGEGTVGLGTGLVAVRLVGGTIYFMGNKNFWTQQGNASDAQLFAGKWVDTAASTTSGKSLAEFLDSATFLKQLFGGSNLSSSKFTKVGTAKVAGKSTVVLSGVNEKTKTSGKIYVATSGPPYILKVVIGGDGDQGSLTFSQFNQPVHSVAPSGAIDLDTLAAG
jgi:hypothetical protein